VLAACRPGQQSAFTMASRMRKLPGSPTSSRSRRPDGTWQRRLSQTASIYWPQDMYSGLVRSTIPSGRRDLPTRMTRKNHFIQGVAIALFRPYKYPTR